MSNNFSDLMAVWFLVNSSVFVLLYSLCFHRSSENAFTCGMKPVYKAEDCRE